MIGKHGARHHIRLAETRGEDTERFLSFAGVTGPISSAGAVLSEIITLLLKFPLRRNILRGIYNDILNDTCLIIDSGICTLLYTDT